MIDLKRPDGSTIKSWEDWTRPKRDYQWKAGRSAVELAKSWFREGQLSTPKELVELLQSAPCLKNLWLSQCIPELVTQLPERGEGRNHDLVLRGQTSTENVTICIEAKADEPFGADNIREYWNRAIRRRSSGVATRVPERIQALLGLVGDTSNVPSESPWGDVRYQLLSAICGTIRQAELDSSSLAVFVVHEFHTELTRNENLVRNHTEFERLLSVLAFESFKVSPSNLYGPFRINGIDCFIGKAVA